MLKEIKQWFVRYFVCRHIDATVETVNSCYSYRYSETSFDQLERVVLRTRRCPSCGLHENTWVPEELP